MDWMLMPLRRYADFSGRSRRKEYWMFVLGTILFYLVVALVLGLLFGMSGAGSGGAVSSGLLGGGLVVTGLFGLAVLALLVPMIAVQVRRFHDQNLSGFMALINLIPYLGGLVVLIFMCLPGTVGPNKYGPDPLEGERGGLGADLNKVTTY